MSSLIIFGVKLARCQPRELVLPIPSLLLVDEKGGEGEVLANVCYRIGISKCCTSDILSCITFQNTLLLYGDED